LWPWRLNQETITNRGLAYPDAGSSSGCRRQRWLGSIYFWIPFTEGGVQVIIEHLHPHLEQWNPHSRCASFAASGCVSPPVCDGLFQGGPDQPSDAAEPEADESDVDAIMQAHAPLHLRYTLRVIGLAPKLSYHVQFLDVHPCSVP
jgi:hypothetical protein